MAKGNEGWRCKRHGLEGDGDELSKCSRNWHWHDADRNFAAAPVESNWSHD